MRRWNHSQSAGIPKLMVKVCLAWMIASLIGSPRAGIGAPRGETTYKRAAIEMLEDPNCVQGTRLRLSGQYTELRDEEVVLVDCPARLVAPEPEVRRRILVLSAVTTNLYLDVVKISAPFEDPVYQVDGAEKGPELERLFAEDLEVLVQDEAADEETLFRFVRRVRKQIDRDTSANLESVLFAACDRAIEMSARLLTDNDVAGRVELIGSARKASASDLYALSRLTQLEQRYGAKPEIRQELASMNARRFRGRWILYEEFKRLQGFELYHEHWVSAREKDFLETLIQVRRGQEQLILRNRTDAEYRLLESRREVATGMTQEEVQRSLGFPDRVYREILAAVEYDQWVYGKQLLYFKNGDLIRISTPPSE